MAPVGKVYHGGVLFRVALPIAGKGVSLFHRKGVGFVFFHQHKGFGNDLARQVGIHRFGLQIGDIVVADALVEHDMDTSPLRDPVGLISGINRIDLPTCKEVADALADAVDDEGITPRRGRIASGDQFVATREQKERILAHFDACVCEMEGAAIAHVAYVNGVDCAVLRAISDNGDEAAAVDYPVFAAEAAEKAARVISRFISSMQKDA